MDKRNFLCVRCWTMVDLNSYGVVVVYKYSYILRTDHHACCGRDTTTRNERRGRQRCHQQPPAATSQPPHNHRTTTRTTTRRSSRVVKSRMMKRTLRPFVADHVIQLAVVPIEFRRTTWERTEMLASACAQASQHARPNDRRSIQHVPSTDRTYIVCVCTADFLRGRAGISNCEFLRSFIVYYILYVLYDTVPYHTVPVELSMIMR